jgi:aspartate carbamoyltransferase catalytic subunit
MSKSRSSLLDLKSISQEKIKSLFSLAKKIKGGEFKARPTGQTLALLFFEASTRTRMSFETAAHRIGISPMLFDGGAKTSLEKGESLEDTILNVAAMKPKAIVIRCGDQVDLRSYIDRVEPVIINAGWGVQGHPTQALLDLFTIHENSTSSNNEVNGKKILFVGDIRHSRVAASHFELAQKFSLEIAVSSPEEFLPPMRNDLKIFNDLNAGLAWADVVIALRCQFERHGSGFKIFSTEDYRKNFGLNSARLKQFSPKGLIMHPGPINHGIEIESEVLKDPRCRVLEQVTNGVYVREAILRQILEGKLE